MIEIKYICSEKIYLYLRFLKDKYKSDEYKASYSDIIEEALLSHYNITLEDLSKINEKSLDNISSKIILEDSGITNTFANYVYIYLDPREPGEYVAGDFTFTHKPIYVGKGQHERYKSHLVSTKNKKFQDFLNELKDNDILPIIQIVSNNLSGLESHRLESNLIFLLKDKCDLCNESGGKYYNSEETTISKFNLELNKTLQIVDTLNSCKKLKDCAKKLGISERSLYRKIKSLNIQRNNSGKYFISGMTY